MQKISLFHQLFLVIQQISEFQDLKAMPIFDQHHQKIVKVTFSFPEFATPDLCRNKANTINFHYRPNSGKINDQIFQ